MKTKYEYFKEIYKMLPYEYKAIIDRFMIGLEHDFKAHEQDVLDGIKKACHKECKKACNEKCDFEKWESCRKQKRVSVRKILNQCNIETNTFYHNAKNNYKKLTGDETIAGQLGISTFELYFGEDKIAFQSRKISNSKATFEYQSENIQQNLIGLAMDLYLLSIGYQEDEYN